MADLIKTRIESPIDSLYHELEQDYYKRKSLMKSQKFINDYNHIQKFINDHYDYNHILDKYNRGVIEALYKRLVEMSSNQKTDLDRDIEQIVSLYRQRMITTQNYFLTGLLIGVGGFLIAKPKLKAPVLIGSVGIGAYASRDTFLKRLLKGRI